MSTWHSLTVDLQQPTFEIHLEPDAAWVGGRELTSHFLVSSMDPQADALGPHNPIVLAVGIAAGSGASSSCRLSIGSKSPLTGGIKESNIGGSSGYALARLGIRSLAITGQSSSWLYLLVSAQGAAFLDASEFASRGIYPVVESLRKRHGKNAAVLAIGQAGELLLPAALIGGTDMDGIPARQAAAAGWARCWAQRRSRRSSSIRMEAACLNRTIKPGC